jgi:hypothetical protein
MGKIREISEKKIIVCRAKSLAATPRSTPCPEVGASTGERLGRAGAGGVGDGRESGECVSRCGVFRVEGALGSPASRVVYASLTLP